MTLAADDVLGETDALEEAFDFDRNSSELDQSVLRWLGANRSDTLRLRLCHPDAAGLPAYRSITAAVDDNLIPRLYTFDDIPPTRHTSLALCALKAREFIITDVQIGDGNGRWGSLGSPLLSAEDSADELRVGRQNRRVLLPSLVHSKWNLVLVKVTLNVEGEELYAVFVLRHQLGVLLVHRLVPRPNLHL